MAKELKGTRSAKEASVVLSSVEVAVQRLDAAGDPSGEEMDLGFISVNKIGETIIFQLPPSTSQSSTLEAPGFKLIVRERGRDSRTTTMRLLFEDAVVDPEPDYEPPTAPTNLAAADVTRTSVSLSWAPSTDNVAVAHYEVFVDGQIAASASGVSIHLANLPNPQVDIADRRVDVRAIDTSGNASMLATLNVPLPSRDVDPGEPLTPWPTIGTVGFLGDVSALTPMRAGAIREAGKIIENRYIDCSAGELGIHAKNVTIRNCIINCGVWGVYAYNDEAEGLVIEDCTFVGGYQAGIGLEQLVGWRVSRCDFYGGRDAVKPGGSGVIEDCTMRDPDTGGDAHNDCLQFSDCDGITVQRCYLAGADTSEIAMFENQGTFRNVTIRNNYLGGAGYAIYAGGEDGANIRIVGNVFGHYGYQHPVTSWEPTEGSLFTGNVFLDGRPVPTP